MKNWMLFGALLYLGGCASHHCENGPNDSQLTDSPCRAGHLLYQNDMLQAKLLISEDNRENYELAEAMLRRAALDDASGEAEFYQAVLLIRQQADHKQIIDLLQTAAAHKHPLAIALLSQQLSISDPKRSEHYRNEYAELDVAKSGYPSFEQALVVIRGLVIPSAQATASN
ncbi:MULTISPECIES: hypothetical protein [Pseudomonas]|uniref:Uncharacterized protein n=3 Tax=Pseudomonas syringae group TaxID=136849 RepID=A0A0Q0E5G0_PSEVI|nr:MULTISPECIES: hypothetical protein [Pseudomonas]MCF8979316.1 hypothetical protein [Pseudomonas syringae]VVM80065.1 hypothetical protein PS634_02269 [Pseudomonas fluorescens]EKN43910.1 hypothetical protein AAI_24601 [Pseudomonas viridiflava UASWS0038]KPL61891.1 hypothetical protein PVFL_25280 [Pseudomonas viridiflava]KPY49527.1 Uncharacterized protein ALO47_01482 [Pseudomonas syringae pv. ribicola]